MSYLIKPKYDLVVYIGRFAPFHLGHEEVLKKAYELGKNVLVLIGSAGESRTVLNPFTASERIEMIQAWRSAGKNNGLFVGKELLFSPLYDETYNTLLWIKHVQDLVEDAKEKLSLGKDAKVALIGCNKDETSFYLKCFPMWEQENATITKIVDWTGKHEPIDISATYIRDIFFSDLTRFVTSAGYYMPIPVMHWMLEFAKTVEYQILAKEYDDIQVEKKKWGNSPYPPVFQTVDAIVIQSGHILLIQRGGKIGHGKWALPGGYLNPNETQVDGIIRELREETGLKVPAPVLKGSIAVTETFDSPRRSQLGRVITRAALIVLKDDFELPHVKGADDAKKAQWVTLSDFYKMRDRMFDDHYHIANTMIRKGVFL